MILFRIPEPNSEPEGSSEPASESEPVSEGSASENRVYKQHAYAPKHDFNPMDCTDIIIGTARNQSSRIHDYYTRDRYYLSMPFLRNTWNHIQIFYFSSRILLDQHHVKMSFGVA